MQLIATSYLNSQSLRKSPEVLRIQRQHRAACEREELLKEWITLRQGDVESHYVELHALRAAKARLGQRMLLMERFSA
jgi:hypothetical protein